MAASAPSGATVARARSARWELYHRDTTTRELPARERSSVQGAIVDHRESWTRDVVQRFPCLRAIVRLGVGLDNVDVDELRRRGIAVGNVPAYGTTDVADHTIALLLDLGRGITLQSEALRESGSAAWAQSVPSNFRLRDLTFGIVGCGRIGTAVGRRAEAFGMRVVFYDPLQPKGIELAHRWRRVDTLHELASCDVISLHCPLTEGTRGMVNRGYWEVVARERRGRGQVLLNTARGDLVDWPGFTAAFDSGIVRCAGLDVLPIEPIDDNDELIVRWRTGTPGVRERLVVTPHSAFACAEAVEDLERGALTTLERLLSERAAERD
ncbi:MAG: NAD(P)-dependent oxidoreductase [Conexibacter sp.]